LGRKELRDVRRLKRASSVDRKKRQNGMVDPISDPIPADVSEAFDQAVSELIAWDGGDEPSVSVSGRPAPISAIARLAGLYNDTMPTSLFWRMVNYANRSGERKATAEALSRDSTYATGAECLLRWIRNSQDRFGEWTDRTGRRVI
jgi:hypothetical protein